MTSASLERLSFWLLGVILTDAAERRRWLGSVDSRARLEPAHPTDRDGPRNVVRSMAGPIAIRSRSPAHERKVRLGGALAAFVKRRPRPAQCCDRDHLTPINSWMSHISALVASGWRRTPVRSQIPGGVGHTSIFASHRFCGGPSCLKRITQMRWVCHGVGLSAKLCLPPWVFHQVGAPWSDQCPSCDRSLFIASGAG